MYIKIGERITPERSQEILDHVQTMVNAESRQSTPVTSLVGYYHGVKPGGDMLNAEEFSVNLSECVKARLDARNKIPTSQFPPKDDDNAGA